MMIMGRTMRAVMLLLYYDLFTITLSPFFSIADQLDDGYTYLVYVWGRDGPCQDTARHRPESFAHVHIDSGTHTPPLTQWLATE